MTGLLLRDVEIAGERLDVRIIAGRVAELGTALAGTDVIDGRGGALLPGLVDHHLHLHAMAAAERSVRCGPPVVHDAPGLAAALAAATADAAGWVRGFGYVESVTGDLDAAALDRLHASRPVRIQHRSGALWTVNGRGAALLGLATADEPGIERDQDGVPTGRIWRADAWLRAHLPRTGPPDLTAVGARLARSGVTAVTDATPDLAPDAVAAIADAAASGALPQAVHLLGAPWHTPLPPRLSAGPYKIVLADSGLPGLDELAATIRAVHATGRAVAAHCVTREALVLLLAALDDAGHRRGDRVEHAALVPEELVGDLARRGLRVVTQPGFLADRGDDFLRGVPPGEHQDLYRCGSLLAAGVPLALSSDAPYGPSDPWTIMAAAMRRRTASGAVVGPAEVLTPRAALDAFLAPPDDPGGPARTIHPGAAADLVLLDGPLTDLLADPHADRVRATIIDGRVVTAG